MEKHSSCKRESCDFEPRLGLMKKNEEIELSIKHNEWFIINGGLNLARLKALGYYVDNDGKKYYVNRSERDALIEHYVYQIESRGRSILSLKDELLPERISDSSEFNAPT